MTDKSNKNHGNFVSVMMNGITQPRRPSKAEKDLYNMAAAQSSKLSPLAATKSKSVPSTPSHRPHSPSGERSTPSTSRPTREGSPRSIHSGSSYTPPAHRRPAGGCKYETGMAKARRRVPYSLGPDKLESNSEEASKVLSVEDEKILTTDIQALYERLLPTAESEERRQSFIQKLENLIKGRWPGSNVNVSVFGSTGNRLGTRDSDIDICITTDCKDMERVCSIAELLANNGMERVVCVSSAKVPIVKVWDPALQVACDMNVNNPIALENTELIKSYVSVDDRFRPLAMIVKYWAKRRMLNDAALGGTLSSYTWICLVLNFLQTRDPPILPSLQNQPNLNSKTVGDINIAFDKNLDKYRDFGKKNTSTLGELLFQFFRYYGHQLDLETSVLSVREGKVIPKSQKGWDRLQDNRLCVEEPFNTIRNLANTADDTSMRGIHLELRRAFGFVASGNFASCCEEYVHAENEYPAKSSEKFIHPTTKTLIPQPPPQPQPPPRTNRSGYKTGRNSNRNNGAGRRSSNPAGRTSTYLRDLPFAMTPQELQLQAQHQQHLLHDQLFQQYQYLQLQEQELRMQLYQQSLRQRGLMVANGYSTGAISSTEPTEDMQDPSLAARTMSTARMPQSAPLYQQRFASMSPYITNAMPSNGVVTNPGSPLLANAIPDSRRYTRRASAHPVTGGSLRAHSQPARSVPATLGLNSMRHGVEMPVTQAQLLGGRRSSIASNPQELPGYPQQVFPMPSTLYDAGRRPVEYVGYYVGQSPSLGPSSRSTAISPTPSNAGLAIHNGGLSPRLSTRSSTMPSVTTSPSIQQATLDNSAMTLGSGVDSVGANEPSGQISPKSRPGPLVVDGSVYSPNRRQTISRVTSDPIDNLTMSASTSEDPAFDTPSSSDEIALKSAIPVRTTPGTRTSLNKIQAIRDAQIRSSNRASQGFMDENRSVGSSDDGVQMRRGNSSDSPLTSFPESIARTTINGVLGYDQAINKHSQAGLFPSEMGTAQGGPLSARTNGFDPASISMLNTANMTYPNGWQTQTKKKKNKKKGGKVDPAPNVNPTGGDALPEDESQRKGG